MRIARSGAPKGRRRTAALVVLLLLWITGCTAEAVVPRDEPSEVPPGPAAAAAARPDTVPEPGAAPPAPERSRPAEEHRKPQEPRDAAPPAPRGERPTVLYLGDSLAMESQLVLGEQVESRGRARVHSAPYSGTTLCDYLTGRPADSLVPPQDKAATLVGRHRPRVVVLQFWGNSWGYTPCMQDIVQGSDQYYRRYAKDAGTLTEQIAGAARAAGIPRPRIVWVLQGPDAFSTDRISRVNDLYRARASASGDAVADAGREVSAAGARYGWTRRLPCNEEERARPGSCRNGLTDLHREDDPLHFCLAPTTSKPRPCPASSPGIVRYTKAIATVVDRYVGRTG